MLASMLLGLAGPTLAGPAASGRIGVSLEIPPRVSLETRQTDASVACITEETDPGRLQVVDAEGRTLPGCHSGRTSRPDRPVQRVMVIPV